MEYLRSRYFIIPALVAFVFVVLLTGLACTPSAGKARAVAPPALPLMGYNTWYEFGAAVSEGRVLAEAHQLAADGLARDGYDLLVIDNGWQAPRRTQSGALTWNTAEFPHGIPWLAQQLGAEGIKLGIYTAIGTHACGPQPASYGHYAQDAATFASWGASFVKVDDCAGLPAGLSFSRLSTLFSQFCGVIHANGMACSEELPVLQPPGSASWLAGVRASSAFADMWRVAPDEHWNQSAQYTIGTHLADDTHLYGFARPGHWNDLDMLVPGTVDAHPFRWPLQAEQAQLAVWAAEASPLFISTSLEKLTAPQLAALENRDVLALDHSGAQSRLALYSGAVTALVKPYAGGSAVVEYNTGPVAARGSFALSALLSTCSHASWREVWSGRHGTLSGVLTAVLAPGQSMIFVLKGI